MNITTPRVSVVMPVYNGERYLKEAIDSILSQTFNDFEFIIINDGSTDNSVDIINSYSDDRIKLYHNTSNKGVIYTSNRGLDLANGKYIVRMDQDDISLKKRFSRQVAYMEENKSIGICGAWIRKMDKKNRILKYPLATQEIKACLFWGTAFADPAVIMRREYIIKYNLKYRSEYLHAQDYGFWVEASGCFDMANIPEVLLHYRVSDGSISNKHAVTQQKTVFNIIKNNFIMLGFEKDEATLNWLIEKVFQDGRLGTLEEVRQFEQCLTCLKQLNDIKAIYSEPYFTNGLAKQLFRVCIRSANLGMGIIEIYKHSPVGGYTQLNPEQVIRLFFKVFYHKIKG